MCGTSPPGAACSGGVHYVPGYEQGTPRLRQEQIDEAVAAAGAARTTVLLLGLPSSFECEGFDREHMRLPEQMNRLAEALAAVTPRLVVVLLAGSPCALPWLARVPAVLLMGLPGQAVGGAMADVLFGDAPPGGKLAETWPLRLEDCPSTRHFGTRGHRRQVVYREGLCVGYRHFAGRPVAFPFGHGLSYAAFEYRDLRLSAAAIDGAEPLQASLMLTNVGGAESAEVVQLYVHPLARAVANAQPRPEIELRAFAKVTAARYSPG